MIPGTAFLFDEAGRLIKTYGPPDHSHLVAGWVPDGTVVLPDVRTGEIRVLDPTTDQQSAEYTGFAGYTEVVIGSDERGGLRGVASSAANGISLWDVATGQPIGQTIAASTNTAFSSGTSFKAVVMGDLEHQRMILWDLDPAVWRVRGLRGRRSQSEPGGVDQVSPRGRAVSRDVSAVPGRVSHPPSASSDLDHRQIATLTP